ncbi:MAG: hypothetical protein KTR31_23025 [Myxococcales bacterium]|nr:hypothetical protein [Myxococcales bacterium]
MRGTVRWMRVAGAVSTVGVLLACSGLQLDLPIGKSFDNVAACQSYVEAYNRLDCVTDAFRISPTDMCPDALDDYPCDMSEHYQCMADRIMCSDGRPDVLDMHTACGDRTCD